MMKWLFSRFAKTPGIVSRILGLNPPQYSLPEPKDFINLAHAGYRQNAIIHACIRTISRSIAEPEIKAVTLTGSTVTTDTYLSGERLAKLIYRPNPWQDQYDFFEAALIDLYVSGNIFIRKIRPLAGGPPIELELVKPHLLDINAGADRNEGKVKSYTLKLDSGDYDIPAEDIIHIKFPDPLDDYWGLSPVFVAMQYIDIDGQALDFLRKFFINRGIPAGLLKLNTGVMESERRRIKNLWREQVNDPEGWHNVAVLDADVDYKPLQSGIKDLQIDTVTSQTETRMCAVMGVPPAIVFTAFGLARATFSNMEESRRLLWVDTLSPMYARISRKLTAELAQAEFGDNRQIIFDLSQVSSLQENRSEIRKIALQGWDSGLLTRRTSSSLLGIAADATQQDVFKVQSGTELRPADAVPGAAKTDDIIPEE